MPTQGGNDQTATSLAWVVAYIIEVVRLNK
jgi:hypothetical protein